MTTIIELQETLQNLTGQKKISFTDIGKALGTGRSNISLRAKNKSLLNNKELKRVEQYFKVDILQMSSNDFIELPVRGDVHASMGSGITVYNEEKTGTYKISRELARDIGINISNSEMIMASGDSMTPTIEGGDMLLIDKNKQEVLDGKIYCIRIDGQLFVKRLQKIPPQKIKVVSDNNKYDAFYIDFLKDMNINFQIIGEVRWWGRIAK